MYLDNLEEAVISKSGDGLKYFNSKGMNLISKCLETNFPNDLREKYIKYLNQMEEEMSSKFQIDR